MSTERGGDVQAHGRRAAAISSGQRETLLRIVAVAAPGAQAYVFGSRANGRNRPFSDIDLLLERQPSLTWEERAALRDAFEASDLPFRVDLVEAGELSGSFRQAVIDERIPL